MTNEVEEKLEELLKKGKISNEDYKELKKLIFGSDEQKRDFEFKGIKRLEIEFFSEDLEIKGTDESNMKVTGSAGRLIMEKDDGCLKIRSKPREFHFTNIIGSHKEPVKVTVCVPKHCDIRVKTISGDLEVFNVYGNITAKSVSGDSKIRDVTGKIAINTVSGDVSLEKCKGEVHIEAKSGDISINECDIKGLVKTYSGDISAVNSELSNMDVTLYNGDFALKSSLLKDNVNVNSMLGDIRCEDIAGDFGFTAETKLGDINLSDSGTNFLIRGESAVYENGKIVEREKYLLGSRLVKENGDFSLNLKTKKGDIFIKI